MGVRIGIRELRDRPFLLRQPEPSKLGLPGLDQGLPFKLAGTSWNRL